MRQKEVNKYVNGSNEHIELLLRTAISANQLGIYGAIADLCDEVPKGTGAPEKLAAPEHLGKVEIPTRKFHQNKATEKPAACVASELCHLHGQREYDWRCKGFQRIPRSMPAACSLTWMMEPSHPGSALPPLRAAKICLELHCKSREYRVDVSQGDRITLSLSPSWTPLEFRLTRISCFPRVWWTFSCCTQHGKCCLRLVAPPCRLVLMITIQSSIDGKFKQF